MLNVIDSDNNIKLNVAIGNTNVLVKFNLVSLSADIVIGDILAKYENNIIYLNYKDIKAKFDISDFDSVMNKLSPILNGRVQLPDIKGIVESIDIMTLLKGAINSLTMSETENALTLSTTIDNIKADIVLNTTNNEYTLNSVKLNVENTNIVATPTTANIPTIADTQNYNDIMPIINLIDDNSNISLIITIDSIKINATINLVELKAFVSVEGVEALIDFNTGDIYARYPGIKAKVNFNDLESILAEIKPIIDKFIGNNTLDSLSLDSFNSIDIDDVLSSINTISDGNRLAIKLSINNISLALNFDTSNKTMDLQNINVKIDDINVTATPSNTALNLDFDTSDNYIDLKELVQTFATPLKNILLGDTLSVSFSGELVSGNTQYVIRTGDIKIKDINSAPKANAKLVLDIITTDENGNATTVTHTITLTYLDPTLVSEGAINVHFTYDNSLDTDILEGTFTTTKATETLEIVKQIYKNMPELQQTLEPIITPDANGNPVLPDLNIDVIKLINAITFAQNVLAIDLNGRVFMDSMPQNICANVSTTDGDNLNFEIPTLTMDNISLNFSATFNKPTDTEITDDLFTLSPSENANDFSTINELLKTLSVTAEHRSFNIGGNAGMSLTIELLGSRREINIANNAIELNIKLDVIDSKTFAIIEVKRNATSVLGINVWKDYDGTSTLYYDTVNKMIYIKVEYRTKSIFGSPKQQTPIYYSYTEEEFGADILTPILNMLRFNDLIADPIKNSANSDTSTSSSPVTIESVLKNYGYDANSKTFNITANLKPLVNELDSITATIVHDDNYNLSTLNANLNVLGFLKVNLNASLKNYDFQNTQALIAEQVNSGKY